MTRQDEERMLRLLPHGLLTVATVVATVAAPAMDGAAAGLGPTLAVTAMTFAWMLVVPRDTAAHWVGRTALAFVLCWLNPFYAIFGFIGYVDAYSCLRWPWTIVGMAAVAVTQAGAQSGGFPPGDLTQGLVFGALVLVNGGIAGLMTRISLGTERRNAELERLNTELEAALAENAALHDELLASARDTGVQEERRRLAREIHDTLAQSLAAIVLQLEASVGGERQGRALQLARQALAEARRSVLDLAPSDLDGATLPQALGAVVQSFTAEREVRCDLVVTGEQVPLHPEVEATVLRVAQESLSNVARHAGAGRVGVTLSYDGDHVLLDVRDDGVGFDTEAGPAQGSFGLRSMRQRAERLAGVLAVESRPGSGCAVSLCLPALAHEAA